MRKTSGSTGIAEGACMVITEHGFDVFWSSFFFNGYTICVSHSSTLLGEYVASDYPVFQGNGGHCMIFKKDDGLFMAYHQPNDDIIPDNEHATFSLMLYENNSWILIDPPYSLAWWWQWSIVSLISLGIYFTFKFAFTKRN